MAALTKVSARHARSLFDRLLDRPDPRALVQRLTPELVTRWIELVGLEDAGDIVALLAPEQLAQVLDQELWVSPRPGQDEAFDAERFALWLRVMVEHGPEHAAQQLRALDFELVALGLSKLLIVLDMDQLARQMAHARCSDDDEQLEKLLETRLHHELEQYRLIARDAGSFEALLAVILELDARDYAFSCALLARCCVVSSDYIEENGGLYEVLSAEGTLEADVAGARAERREQRGFVPASSALAFLRLAQDTPLDALLASRGPDPLTRAHFRAAPHGAAVAPAGAPEGSTAGAGGAGAQDGGARALAALEVLLAEPPVRRLASGEKRGKASPLARALRALAEQDAVAYARCMHEAAYLATVLLVGAGTRAERLTQEGALSAAHALVELGAEELTRAQAERGAGRARLLRRELALEAGLVKLFRIGFRQLRSVPVAALAQRPALRALRALWRAQEGKCARGQPLR